MYRRRNRVITIPPEAASPISSSAVVVLLLRILLLVSLSSSPFSSGFGATPTKSPSKKSSLSSSIAPEISLDRKKYASKRIDQVFGVEDSGTWDERRDAARATTLSDLLHEDEKSNDDNDDDDNAILQNIPEHELAYGELGIDPLITILDAIGVQKGDTFLDIGSGDGLLVVGAALLYPEYLKASRGIEIVPKLYKRSMDFRDRFDRILQEDENENENEEKLTDNGVILPEVSFDLGNIYEPSADEEDGQQGGLLFSETTIAVCFATTWSKNIPGKRLDRLSKSLGRNGCSELPVGAKVVIIDGVLDHQNDGYIYEGELKLHCPDTAPYSIARLYTRK